MHPIAAEVERRGGLAKAAQLVAAGFPYRALSAAVRSGAVQRVRQGWYAVELARPAWVEGVRVGGRICCVTAAHAHGLWVLDSRRPHVQVPPSARNLRATHHRLERQRDHRDAVVHWVADACRPTSTDRPRHPTAERPADDSRRVAPIIECLVQIARCRPWREAVAVWDSALHQKRVTRREFEAALTALGGTLGERMRDAVDARAESGIESMIRVDLRDAGFTVRTQVRIPGSRRRIDVVVDLPGGAWIGIECDGAHHAGAEQQRIDRMKDAMVTIAGGWSLHFTGAQIIAARETVLAAVRAAARSLLGNDDRISALARRRRPGSSGGSFGGRRSTADGAPAAGSHGPRVVRRFRMPAPSVPHPVEAHPRM